MEQFRKKGLCNRERQRSIFISNNMRWQGVAARTTSYDKIYCIVMADVLNTEWSCLLLWQVTGLPPLWQTVVLIIDQVHQVAQDKTVWIFKSRSFRGTCQTKGYENSLSFQCIRGNFFFTTSLQQTSEHHIFTVGLCILRYFLAFDRLKG